MYFIFSYNVEGDLMYPRSMKVLLFYLKVFFYVILEYILQIDLPFNIFNAKLDGWLKSLIFISASNKCEFDSITFPHNELNVLTPYGFIEQINKNLHKFTMSIKQLNGFKC